jgi:hypothetical protein
MEPSIHRLNMHLNETHPNSALEHFSPWSPRDQTVLYKYLYLTFKAQHPFLLFEHVDPRINTFTSYNDLMA